MRRFHCTCGQEVFFEDISCPQCKRWLGFCPETRQMLAIHPQAGTPQWMGQGQILLRACGLREHTVGCNWLIPLHDPHSQCPSCRLTRTIPDQSIPINVQRWAALEKAKRRLVYSLLALGLPIVQRHPKHSPHGLAFDFLEDKRSNPSVQPAMVYTGHHHGLITLNVIEADNWYRIQMRDRMNERYRTLLGHMRHEIGHYYWDKLIKDSRWYARFRNLFGQEDKYKQALDHYYQHGPRPQWEKRHITAYASAHAWEDWAETWAHYLHIMDTLETAEAYSFVAKHKLGSLGGFRLLMQEWQELSTAMNALNRSMGQQDAYPFTLSRQVTVKLRFIHQVVLASAIV